MDYLLESVELVVQEFANVPRQIIVTVYQRYFGQQICSHKQSFFERCAYIEKVLKSSYHRPSPPNLPAATRMAIGTATPAAPAINKIDVTASQCFDGSHPKIRLQ